jgi:hypothetical protein
MAEYEGRVFCRRAKKSSFPLLCQYQGVQCETFRPSFMTVFAPPQDLPREWKSFEAGAKRVLLMAHLGANMQ